MAEGGASSPLFFCPLCLQQSCTSPDRRIEIALYRPDRINYFKVVWIAVQAPFCPADYNRLNNYIETQQ